MMMIGCSSRNSLLPSTQRGCLENQASVTTSSQFEPSLPAIPTESSEEKGLVAGYCKLESVLKQSGAQVKIESLPGERIVDLPYAKQENLGDSTASLKQFAEVKFEEYNPGFSKNLAPLHNAVGQQSLKDLEFRRSLADISIHDNSNTISLTPMKSFDSNKLPAITSEFGFYSGSNVASSCREVSSACQTDNMFEDAFNLDEFMFGNHANQPMPVKYQNSCQTESQQNLVVPTCLPTTRSNAQHIVGSVDQDRDFMQHFFNNQDNMTKIVFHPEMQEPPPYNEIRNRTFSDLLCYDSSGVSVEEGGAVNTFTNLFEVGRTRDYSMSSDSGVGSSILMDSRSSPPSNNGSEICNSTDPKRPESVTFDSAEDFKNRKQSRSDGRLSSNGSVCSRKLSSDDANADFLPDELSPSVDDPVSPSGAEKVSSKKTAYNEKWGVKVLKAWCVEMNVQQDFEKQPVEELNNILSRFWTEVRKSNGDYYGRNSLFNLRAMINKHLKGKPYCVPYDIVTDERFRSSNDRLEKQLKMLKGMGKTITHKQPISIADLRKMYDTAVLGTANPLALLRKVWFEITLHFCHKGAESQEKLLKTSFQVFRDHNFRTYVSRTACEKSSQDTDEIRMYETGGELCPVQSFQLYLRKLHPLQSRLFQQPRRKSTPASPMWYGKAPIGEKALQQMMANISVSAKLSTRYTNHCVRTTALEQFSNCRKKNKSLHEPIQHAASREFGPLHHNHLGYSTQTPMNNGYGQQHQSMNYDHKATLPSYPEMTQQQQQQLGSQYQYPTGAPQNNFIQMNVPNDTNDVANLLEVPSPIRPAKASNNIRPDGRSQCYKRSMSVAFPESENHLHYHHHHHPPPPYVSEAKRSKTDSENLYHLPSSHGTMQNDGRYHSDLNGLDNVNHDNSALHHITMANSSQIVNNGYYPGDGNNSLRKMMPEPIITSEIMSDGNVHGTNCSIMPQGVENSFLIKHPNAGTNHSIMLEYS